MTVELKTADGAVSAETALPILCKACQYNRILTLMLTALAERETDVHKKYDLLTAAAFVEETYNWINAQIHLITEKKGGAELDNDVQQSISANYH